MNFTREPIIETVITPKEGYKLLLRNSKSEGQEEFFVDAVEVISFGNAIFFRSLEKPKCFLIPVNDYEVVEVRESRMVLKTTSVERGIKIAGGREAPLKVTKEETIIPEVESTAAAEQRTDKRRERRRSRKKKGRNEQEEENQEIKEETPFSIGVVESELPIRERKVEKPSLIPPPATLISETLSKYKAMHTAETSTEEEKSILIPPPIVEPDMSDDLEKDEEIPF